MLQTSGTTVTCKILKNYDRFFVVLFTIFTLLIFSFGNKAQAADYQVETVKSLIPGFYVSPTGNDNNNGTSPSTPWRSLQKVNSTNFPSGSVVAFERGGEWYGQLNIPVSNLTITAYGSGEKPKIHGWRTLSGWVNEGGGNFSVTDAQLLSTARILTIGDKIYNRGRFPKNGWLRTNSSSGGLASGSVSSNSLSGTPNFNGGQIVLNKNAWIIDVGNITSHSGNTIGYSGTSGHYRALVHHGFFIQNHINALTQFGDWMYDGVSKKLTMHFGSQGPGNHIVKVSSIEDVIVINGRSNILIENISIQGSNRTAIRLIGSGARNITIRDCDILKSGFDGIFMDSSGGHPEGLLVENCTLEDTKNRGIETHESRNVTIRNNVIRRTFLDPAGGNNGDFSGVAISLGATGFRGGDFTIVGNRIYDSGYNAIRFSGSNVLIEKNLIERYNLTKTDGGGIYGYGKGQSSVPGDIHINRIVRRNIISNANYTIPILTQWNNEDGFAIYFDDKTRNVICEYNTLIDNSSGIMIHNSRELVIRHNLIFNSRSAGVDFADDEIARSPDGDVVNINFQNNIIYSLGESRVLVVHNQISPVINLGTVNNNHYLKPTGRTYVEKHRNWSNYEYMTLQQWRNNYGYDMNTRTTPTSSTVAAVYFNPNPYTNLSIDVGRNRIDVNGNAINNSIITFEPFQSMLVLGGEPAATQPEPVDQSWLLNILTTGQGSVIRDPNKTQYSSNETVRLTATPQNGWEFAGWSGDLTGSANPVNVVMAKNTNVTANFRQIPAPVTYTITFNVLNPTGQPITNAIVTFNGVSNTAGNYIFSGISAGTYNYRVSAPGFQDRNVSGIVVNQNMTVPVSMTAVQQSTHTVTFNVVNPTGQPINNAVVTLNDVSNPEGSYVFAGISPGTYNYRVSAPGFNTVNGSNLSVTQNMTVLVNMATSNRIVNITATVNPPGFAFVSGAGEFQEMQKVEVTATPVDEDYRFVGWEENGISVSTQNPFQFQASRNKNIEARFVFEPRQFKVEATVNLAGAGEISGAGFFFGGQVAELHIQTHENIVFIGWRNSAGQIVSRQNPYSIEVNRDIELQAIVELKASMQFEGGFRLKVYPNPSDGVFYSNLEEEAELEIYDSNGVLLQKRHEPAGQNPINLTELPAGIYLLKFYVFNEVFTQKVLIR